MSENTDNEICSPTEILSRQLEDLLSYVKTAAIYERNGLKAISGKPFQEKRFTEITQTLPAKHLQKVYDSIEPAIQSAKQVSHSLAKDVLEILKKLSETRVELSLERVEIPDKKQVFAPKHFIDGSVEIGFEEVKVDAKEKEVPKLRIEGLVANYIDKHRKELNDLAIIICKLKELSFSKITPARLLEGDSDKLIKEISQLRTHFEDIDKDFPLLTYAVMKWPYLRQAPEIPKRLVIKQDGDCRGRILLDGDSIALIQNSSEGEPTPAGIKCWILRPDGQLWDWNVALNRLKEFGNKAEEIREKIEPIVYPMNTISEKWQRWLVFLYDKANPESHTDFETLYLNSTGNTYPEITTDLPCYSVLDDVFLKSKLACDDLLGMLKPESEQPQEQKEEAPSGLPPAREKAYQSYQYAVAVETNYNLKTDREVYDWLKDNGHSDYELPAFETWQRYVRDGRKYYGTPKNTPRAGRFHARSIITADQLSSSFDEEDSF